MPVLSTFLSSKKSNVQLKNTPATEVALLIYGVQLSMGYAEHTSIHAGGSEICYYKQLGSIICEPGASPSSLPYKRIVLGHTDKTSAEVLDIAINMRPKFNKSTYDVRKNNCNHLSNALSKEICGVPIPNKYVTQDVGAAQDAVMLASLSLLSLSILGKKTGCFPFFKSAIKSIKNLCKRN